MGHSGVATHTWSDAVALVANMHVVASLDNGITNPRRTGGYEVKTSFYGSWCARHPRRSCDTWRAGLPGQSGTSNASLGAFAGVGGGLFMTNAGNSTSLGGPFTSYLASIGIFGFEFDYSKFTWGSFPTFFT